MCILCVIQKWSRRVATMLPWLVIPLIALWALSQTFPPAYQFEITSPRLACVFVLLFTLFWYEVLMPQLSTWQVRRNARLRERKRSEAIEMQKLRKTATRRCRNCLNPYRDQNPAGGRFMCSYCGHISKRPVLDLPVPPGLGLSNFGILKGLVGKGGKIWNGKVWADNGCMCGEDWLENGNWVDGSSAGNSCYFRKNGGGSFGGHDHCMAEKSYSHVVIFASKILTAFFLSIRWLWRKISRISSSGDDTLSETEHRDNWSERGENGEDIHESRGEKARRKAEEKKQARLERELLEEEERKQREEVARLVEDRRKLRDEILMAEKSRGKGSNSDRDKDSKKEAEKKRQERRKEQDKGSSKSNSDAEELERRKEKDKGLLKTTGEIDRWEHYKTAAESAKAHSADTVHGFRSATVNNHSRENAGSRYLDRMRGTFLSSSKAFSGGSFFGRGANTYATVSRENKPNGSVDHIQTSVRELSRSEHVSAKPNILGDDKNINHPVLVEPQPTATPKKSWQQLFTRSSAPAPPANTSVISRPNAKVQTEVQSPPLSRHLTEAESYINPLNFGLPSPFALPTSPYVTTSNSTVLPLASEAMFPRFEEAPLEFLPEESDIFEEPCFVPDPVSLLGPVSESLDNFQSDMGGGFVPGMGLEMPHALKNMSTSSEATRPSPIGSPMLGSRVSDERHSCSSPFPCTPEAQFKHTLPMDDLSNSNDIRTWQMWNTSPLGQDGLGLFMRPIAHETMTSLFTEDNQALSGTHSSPNVFLGNAQNGRTFGTHIPCSSSDPWLPKTLLGAMPGCENNLSLNPPEYTSQQNEMIYGSPNASATNHPLDLPPANCWTKKEWAVPGTSEGSRNSSIQRPHVGGLYSNPDVQSLW